MDDVENYISLAEIDYKSGNFSRAIRHAERAIETRPNPEQKTALQIFIARTHSKLGNISESNKIYRELLTEKNYLPPVIMGLLYNNFKSKNGEAVKMGRNLGLIKIFVEKGEH